MKNSSGGGSLRAVARSPCMPSVAVDVMSGDSGAPECIPGALLALVLDPTWLILVGNPSHRTCAGPGAGGVRARVRASGGHRGGHVRTSARGHSPRKDSSMRIAIDLVKEAVREPWSAPATPAR